MLNRFYRKLNHLLVTLRVSILTIFITLFMLAILIVMGVTYLRFSTAIEKASFQFMHQVASTAYNGIATELRNIAVESKFSANLIETGIVNPDNDEELLNYTYDLIRLKTKMLPSVQAAYWGGEDGTMVLSSRLDDLTIVSDIVSHKKKSIREIIFKNLQGIENPHQATWDLSYDHRVRPWYMNAKKLGESTWTDVYLYHTGYLGITVATPVYQQGAVKGVFALSVRLDYLRHFLEAMKISQHGIIFITNKAGQIISFPGLPQYNSSTLKNISDIHPDWIQESFKYYQQNHQGEFIFKYQGERYLAVYSVLPELSLHSWILGVVAPEKDFTGELIRTNYLILLVGILMLVFGILLMSMLVSRIVNPLKKLVTETENIKHFELEETPLIRSHIKEIFHLSTAISAMKKGLRAFQQYVPATLVRNLIETGQDSTIGGEKKTLAIFFSDIENFTATAEHMDPNQLMEYLCDYFNELTHIIIESQGTIDKYIGDSIMAFWGAPLSVKNPCAKAASAILRCKKRLAELYNQWKVEDRKIFKTRMGLHYGEVVVGNLGSRERLSYTAVGDAINISSRLEGLNKVYGTQIIVSEAFFNEIKNDFVLRQVDCVIVKGKDQAMNIYELLANNANELTFNFVAYQAQFKQAFSFYQQQQWDNAIIYFNHCLEIFPEDSVALTFLKRIAYLRNHPPESNWDGVFRFQEK